MLTTLNLELLYWIVIYFSVKQLKRKMFITNLLVFIYHRLNRINFVQNVKKKEKLILPKC